MAERYDQQERPSSTVVSTDLNIMRLNETNYTGWKFQMRMILEAKKLWVYTQEEDLSQDINAKRTASLILSYLSYDNIMKVINCETAYEIWQALEAIYENRTTSEKQTLLAKFHSFKIHSLREISKNLGEIQSMAARLKSLGAAIDDDSVMSIILNALPSSFNNFKTSWNLFNVEQRELNKLISCILVEAQNMRNPEERALIARGSGTKPEELSGDRSVEDDEANIGKDRTEGNCCPTCKRPYKNRKSRRDKRNDRCNHCHEKGHWANECPKKNDQDDQSGNNAEEKDQEEQEDTWAGAW